MKISYNHESIRLTGRWDTQNKDFATATATGSYIEFCFKGTLATALFNCDNNKHPFPHLWVQIDDGNYTETVVDNYLKIPFIKGAYHKTIKEEGKKHAK